MSLLRAFRRQSDWHGTLAFLSIAHCPLRTPVPSPLDNQERYHEFRKRWRAPVGNDLNWADHTHRDPRPAHAGTRPGA